MITLLSRVRLVPVIAPAVLFAVLATVSSDASARGGGGYGAYQRYMQQQMQTMQKQSQAMQKQQQEEHDAFIKRFDTNKNGKIDGKEKAPAQKYLRQLEQGVDPDRAIKSLGRPTRSK